jgi:transcriptional regulator with XRE-family HTH domain
LKRRRQAALLRAEGFTLEEIGRRLGVTRQGAHVLLRGSPTVACPRCGEAIVSAWGLGRKAGTAVCLACLAGRPGASLGQRLKSFRLAAGLLQRELARETGMGQQRVWSYERDRNRPRPDALARLAKALEPGGPVPVRLERPK